MTRKAEVKAEMNDDVGSLVVKNQDKHNALDQQAWHDIPKAVDQLLKAGARVIVVSGYGESFCAGADISEFDTVRKDESTARIYEKANADAFAAIRNTPVPTIAKIRGFCLGGGFGLAAACDIRLAADDARFAVPAAKLGLAYPVDAMADIVHAIGAQNAKRLLFTAKQISAADMLNYGFLNEILPAEQLDEHVTAIANDIATLAPLTHRATKAAIDTALNGNVTRNKAAQIGDQTFASADYAEGRKAFKEKRKAKFTGR